jgi:hypothetical protein
VGLGAASKVVGEGGARDHLSSRIVGGSGQATSINESAHGVIADIEEFSCLFDAQVRHKSEDISACAAISWWLHRKPPRRSIAHSG